MQDQEQQDLGFGFNGGFNTPFGGASGGFGWNQEQQDLFFGLLPSLIGGLMGGARQQQDMKSQDLGFKINGCINTSGLFGGRLGGNLCMGNLQQQMEEQNLQLGALLPIASALAPAIGQGIAALINGGQLENLQALPEDLQWQALIPIATSLAPVVAQGIGKLIGGMDQQEQDLQWQALIPIATSLAPVVAQGIGALINGGKVQNLSQEDLQWGGLAGLAGALAPVAAQVIGGMLQTGGAFSTAFGNAMAGGMDEEQDLQLGGLIKLGLSLLGSQQQQDFGLFGSILKTGLSLAGKAAKSQVGKYAIKEGGKLALDAGKNFIEKQLGGQ